MCKHAEWPETLVKESGGGSAYLACGSKAERQDRSVKHSQSLEWAGPRFPAQRGVPSAMSQIVVRPARGEDREAILAFCAKTWEWGDYIAFVWAEWLTDPSGALLVAPITGRPVGLLRLHMLTATDAWQEGMRVDPAYRHQGISRHLSLAVAAEALRRGATTFRTLIHSTNQISLHIVEQAHFRRVSAFALYTAVPLTSPSQHTRGLEEPGLARPDDLMEIVAYLKTSRIFSTLGGLYYAGYTGYRLSDTLLAEKIQAGQVFLVRRDACLDGVAIAEPREDEQGPHLFLGYLDGTSEAIR